MQDFGQKGKSTTFLRNSIARVYLYHAVALQLELHAPLTIDLETKAGLVPDKHDCLVDRWKQGSSEKRQRPQSSHS